MKFKTYTGITWSILELTGLLEDEDSRVCFERYKKHLGLHPFHLNNLNAALNEILSSNLNSYDAELKGFLLAYKNPRLLTPLGDTFYDTCFIHVDVEADFYIFRPEVGCSLKGVVNKKGLTHIGVLVHKAFNVSIPKPDDDENWVGDNIEYGQEVRFTVTHLDFSSRLPFIRGALNAETYLQGCKLPDKQNFTCNNRVIFNDNRQDAEETEATRVPVVKPKHNKQRMFFTTNSEDSSEEDRIKIKKQILETSTPKRSGKTIISAHDEKEAEVKKRVKISKTDKETKVKIIDMKTVQRPSCNTTVNSIIADEESEEDLLSRKRKVQKIINHDSPDETMINHESKKAQTNLSKKTSKKSSIAEGKDGIINIKQEKIVAASNVIERSIAKDTSINTIKSSKHPMKQKDYLSKSNINDSTSSFNDANKSVPSPNKKRVKKPMSDSESEDAFVTIKTEKLNDTPPRNNNVEDEVAISPSKIQHKKRVKKPMSDSESEDAFVTIKTEKLNDTPPRNNNVEEEVAISPSKKQHKKRVKKPMSDSESKDACVTIKTEKLNDTPPRNNNVEEEVAISPSKKQHKKRVKKPMSDSESEDAFVTIKTEKLNDTPPRNNNVEEEVAISPSKKQHKKRVKKPMSDSESEDAFVTIKTEKLNDTPPRNNNVEEEVAISPSKKQHKKRVKKPMSASESEDACVTIKTEKLNDTPPRNNNVEEEVAISPSKKQHKKRVKKPMSDSESEDAYVTIKTEKLNDTPPRNNNVEEEVAISPSKKQHKKRAKKPMISDSDPEDAFVTPKTDKSNDISTRNNKIEDDFWR